jgi:hypothetical protein
MIVSYNNQDYYRKQVDVARLFRVSEGTITNWIKRGKENKNLLQLSQINNRFYILKTEHNFAELTKLSIEAEDFQNVEYKQVYADPKLYSILTDEQLLALTNSVIINSSIPLKYVYMGDGAKNWDEFYNTIYHTNDKEIKKYGLDADEYLFEKTFSFLERYMEDFDIINIIDIGPGNSRALFDEVENLIDRKKLGHYIAVDISDTMLEIAQKTFTKKFSSIYFKSFQLDFEINSLQNILFAAKDINNDKKILNIVTCLGATIGNVESQTKVLQNIKEGLFSEDLLVISNPLDDPSKRSFFATLGKPIGDKHALYISSLLGLNQDHYTKELIYNPENKHREYNLIMKQAIQIVLKDDRIINLSDGQKLNVWRNRQDTFEYIAQKMQDNNFNLQFIARHSMENKVIYVGSLV